MTISLFAISVLLQENCCMFEIVLMRVLFLYYYTFFEKAHSTASTDRLFIQENDRFEFVDNLSVLQDGSKVHHMRTPRNYRFFAATSEKLIYSFIFCTQTGGDHSPIVMKRDVDRAPRLQAMSRMMPSLREKLCFPFHKSLLTTFTHSTA